MDRRRFLQTSLVGTLAAPLVADAQQADRTFRLGYLSPRSGMDSREEAFLQALRRVGYIEGQNLVIEWRFTMGEPVSAQLAADLIRLKPDCLVVTGIANASVMKKATATIPIVIGNVDADPVEEGLVASFARPGGNITGVTGIAYNLAGKRLEFLREAVPRLSRVAILVDPSRAADAHVREAKVAAGNFRIELQVVEARSAGDLEGVFRLARQKRAEAFDVVATGLLNSHRARIVSLAAVSKLPAMYSNRDFVFDGGLMSYAADPIALFQRAATYVDKILKGAKPGDLPVEQPTAFELVINLKTAKALGLTIPPSLLARADQVIE